jgi:hypothetical protein
MKKKSLKKYFLINDVHVEKTNIVLQTMKQLIDKGIYIEIVADLSEVTLPKK